MNVVVIGDGSIGTRHSNNLFRMKHSVSMIDSDPSITSPAMLSAYLHKQDAAVICVPTDQHLSVLRHCLSAGVPAYIEKPLGKFEEIDAWKALAEDAHLPLTMVGYQLRFHKRVQHIKSYNWTQDTQPTLTGNLRCWCDMSKWKGKSAIGNFLAEMSHEIDLAMYLGAGALTSWKCDMDKRYAMMLFGRRWSVELAGSAKTYQRLWEVRDEYSSTSFEHNDPASLGNDMYIDAMRHFLDAVAEQRPITQGCTLSEAIEVMDVIRKVSGS